MESPHETYSDAVFRRGAWRPLTAPNNDKEEECGRHGGEGCCQRMLCAGQLTSDSLRTGGDAPVEPITLRHRLLALMGPALVVNAVWWAYMLSTHQLDLFTGTYGGGEDGTPRWYLSLTMVFGSIAAGATSVGGGAVSFPVMTLAFGLPPLLARDFSLMIQSVGMTSASVTTVGLGVLVDWTALQLISGGGVVGIVLGLELVRLSPPFAKMYFSALWGAFAFALFLLNQSADRKVALVVNPPGNDHAVWRDGEVSWGVLKLNSKAVILVATGVAGGLCTSVAGTGIDICAFAVLTLYFRVSEKVATPTSVIAMAVNSVVGFAYRLLAQGGVTHGCWGFFLVCCPIVCVGAPLGSLLSSLAHRLVLAGAVYVLDFVQLASAIAVVQPWRQHGALKAPLLLCLSSVGLFAGSLGLFAAMQTAGGRLLDRVQTIEAAQQGGATTRPF